MTRLTRPVEEAAPGRRPPPKTSWSRGRAGGGEGGAAGSRSDGIGETDELRRGGTSSRPTGVGEAAGLWRGDARDKWFAGL
jgi:hypothetical protein